MKKQKNLYFFVVISVVLVITLAFLFFYTEPKTSPSKDDCGCWVSDLLGRGPALFYNTPIDYVNGIMSNKVSYGSIVIVDGCNSICTQQTACLVNIGTYVGGKLLRIETFDGTCHI